MSLVSSRSRKALSVSYACPCPCPYANFLAFGDRVRARARARVRREPFLDADYTSESPWREVTGDPYASKSGGKGLQSGCNVTPTRARNHSHTVRSVAITAKRGTLGATRAYACERNRAGEVHVRRPDGASGCQGSRASQEYGSRLCLRARTHAQRVNSPTVLPLLCVTGGLCGANP